LIPSPERAEHAWICQERSLIFTSLNGKFIIRSLSDPAYLQSAGDFAGFCGSQEILNGNFAGSNRITARYLLVGENEYLNLGKANNEETKYKYSPAHSSAFLPPEVRTIP
jgi:hypothetical protein